MFLQMKQYRKKTKLWYSMVKKGNVDKVSASERLLAKNALADAALIAYQSIAQTQIFHSESHQMFHSKLFDIA